MECLLDHIVLNVQNVDELTSFYANILGFAPERLEEYRAGKVPFPSVRLNEGTIIDLFPKKMWEKYAPDGPGRENLNHFCIAVSKEVWEVLADRLQRNGVEIEEGPVLRWGAHGTGTSIYFRDPEGNVVEARYYESRENSENCLLGS